MLVEIEITALVVKDGQVVMRHWHQDAFLPQRPHEELQVNGGKDAEHERCQDQDAGEPLHRLDEAVQRLLQT